MKGFSILTLIVFLVSLSAAIPVPGSKDGDGDKPSQLDKGKGRAIDPPSRPSTPPSTPPPSRPSTPSPELDHAPLPGRSGVHTDPNTGVVTAYYGDDRLPEHMGHLQRNQQAFPQNLNPQPLSNDPDRNRRDAVRNIPPAGRHPVTGWPRVKDEKLPASLHNPNHATSTTVEYLPEHESSTVDRDPRWKSSGETESGLMRTFQSTMKNAGPNTLGQLRPNPGWLPLDPDQRRGHEAPARLNSQVTQSSGPSTSGTSGRSSKKATQDPEEKKRKEAELKKAKKAGYTPDPVGPSGMTLRHRKGVPQPPPPPPPRERKPPSGPSNLRPGRVAPAGHVWRPSTEESRASHFGAPGPLQGAEQRYPPRPQNQEHYEKQKAAEAKKKDAKQAANLAKFEKEFGPAKKGNGAGGAHEAPARMQTHVNPSGSPSPQPPARRPSSQLPARPPNPQPPSRPSSPQLPSRPPSRQQPSRPPSRQQSSRPPNPARATRPKAEPSSKQASGSKGGRRRG